MLKQLKLVFIGVLFSLIVIGIMGSLASCGESNKSISVGSLPFIVKGTYFELHGNSSGYNPGGTYEFNLTLRNDSDTSWKSNYYAFLIDKNGPVLNVETAGFELLHKGDQENTVIKMTLPENFKTGAYGFAIFFPERGSTVTTIYIGEQIANESAGPWPDITGAPRF